MSTLQWYAYRHIDGGIHLKRFFGDHGDIVEARSSPFVKKVTGPFDSNQRSNAMDIAKARLSNGNSSTN